ncbi:MAG: GH36 C-terminal domain-containing protein, partial [Thermoguttaceae bacterium]|nr:GH36 C-terminal domain-containing protein [Thermoguttaceae bacterium]
PLLRKDHLSDEGVDYQRNIWIGWQYNDPKTGTGAVQMFRRVFSPYKVGTFPLYGLDAEALYTVSDYDSGTTAEFTGEELMTRGLDIEIDEAPGAAIVTYKKK